MGWAKAYGTRRLVDRSIKDDSQAHLAVGRDEARVNVLWSQVVQQLQHEIRLERGIGKDSDERVARRSQKVRREYKRYHPASASCSRQ